MGGGGWVEREREREEMRAGQGRRCFIPCCSEERGFAKWARGQHSQSCGDLEDEYKEKVMAVDVISLFHLGSEMAPEKPLKEEEGDVCVVAAEVRSGECVLTKTFERSCYELVVNPCIL